MYADNIIREVKQAEQRLDSKPDRNGVPNGSKAKLDHTARLIRYAQRSLTGK